MLRTFHVIYERDHVGLPKPTRASACCRLYEADFDITHMDDGTVTASNIPALGCIRQTILIDRLAKTVTFSRSKISDEDACDFVRQEPLTMRLGN